VSPNTSNSIAEKRESSLGQKDIMSKQIILTVRGASQAQFNTLLHEMNVIDASWKKFGVRISASRKPKATSYKRQAAGHKNALFFLNNYKKPERKK